jgi:hypothetical protein
MLPLPLFLMVSIKLKLVLVGVVTLEAELDTVDVTSPPDTGDVRCVDVVATVLLAILLFSSGVVEMLFRKNRRNILVVGQQKKGVDLLGGDGFIGVTSSMLVLSIEPVDHDDLYELNV